MDIGPTEPAADWPIVPGAYAVGDPQAPVAICTLTDDALYPKTATLPGVAIAGRLNTANLGIEDLIANVTANSSIRFLLLCGPDSPVFKQGQSLRALLANGVDDNRQIREAPGHNPVLRNVSAARIARFREQVELIDMTSSQDLSAIGQAAQELAARTPGPFRSDTKVDANDVTRFAVIAPGGKREPLWYDPKGFFVVRVDHAAGEIVARHFERDYRPAHEMRSHSGEAILLGLLREELVSQLSHAGYLGAELAKAEAALRLGHRYAQDQPLRLSP